MLLLAAGFLPSAFASNWPSWRGPNHDGVTDETDLPIKWSTSENVKWKVSLPDRGNSTPVVWGDKLFLTQAVGEKRMLLCFDKKSGKQLWEAGTTWSKPELYPRHESVLLRFARHGWRARDRLLRQCRCLLL